jgi:hypothetical protein
MKNKKSLSNKNKSDDNTNRIVNDVKIRRNKLKIILPIVIILIILIAIISYFYIDNSKNSIKDSNNISRVKNISEYKKSIYEAASCQYDCPLDLQTDKNNNTQLMPNKTCLFVCSKLLRKDLEKMNFTKAELYTDNLFVDMENTIKSCRINNTYINKTINNREFLDCAAENLGKIKPKYEYLN